MGWVRRATALMVLVLATGVAACQPPPSGPQTEITAPSPPLSATGRDAAPINPTPAAQSAWPPLPENLAELDDLITAQTRRPPRPHSDLTAERVIGALRDGVERGTAAMGWAGIITALDQRLTAVNREGRSGYLLFGSHHDAPAQVEAFRRVTGPLGLEPAPLIALEQLHAEGRWPGVPQADQLGDGAALAGYLEAGRLSALVALRDTQQRRNYTGWKYGYVGEIVDLVVAARAGRHRLMGCDMPSRLQTRLRTTLGDRGGELRDLHCALSLRDVLTGHSASKRVALFWGDAHLQSGRLPRFLPGEAEIWTIHLLGGRSGRGGLEAKLAPKVQLADPVLLVLDQHRLVLLLPDPSLGATVDRVRRLLDEPLDIEARHRLVVHGLTGSSVRVGSQQLATPTDGDRLDLPPRNASFLIERDGVLFAGGLPLPAGGQIELHMEMDGTLRMVILAPKTPPQ